MNEIHFTINREANYTFHMLSVARCGYDNRYGANYRNRYPKEDLELLKALERELTVVGGEHVGELTYFLAGSCLSEKSKAFFEGVLDTIRKNGTYEGFENYTQQIVQIATILSKHYEDYINNIWPLEKAKLQEWIKETERLFEECDFCRKANDFVKIKATKEFHPSMVASIEGGAEAIFISENEDIFGVERDARSSLFFIAHEYIIYLLSRELPIFENSLNPNAYHIGEGLAEYYLKQILYKEV